MKSLAFLLAGNLVLAAAMMAAPLNATSRISAVSVYADRARVTRTAAISLPEGESVVRFGGLPEGLDESSVQAAGSATGALRILGLELRTAFAEETVNVRVRELETQRQGLDDRQAVITSQIADIQESRAFLQKVRDGLVLGGKNDDRVPPQGLDKVKPLFEFYASGIEALTAKALAAQISLRELQPKFRLIDEELARLRGNSATSQKEVLVAVRAAAPLEATLTVTYNMNNASWQPLYDARINTKDGRIELSSYGVIRQSTGEDWSDVRVSLSTARPSAGARMPELQPWWLRIQTPMPMAEKPESSTRRDNSLGFARDQAPAPAPAEALQYAMADEETATIDSAGISTVFEIKIPATIPGDNEPHKVAIATQSFDGKLEWIATPKLSDAAFIRSRLTNTSPAPLLGGEVNLFRDGDFVGRSRINFIAPTAQFDFYLGVDDSVKITRKTLADKTAEAGFLTKKRSVTRQFETTVENFRAQPIKVAVVDQLPVSQDATITVSNVRFSEPPKDQEKETGKLTWEFTLDPRQKKTLGEEFTIEWPNDRSVGGL